MATMLHWFAGQKLPEGPSDPDATGYIEPPETPAPIFAVRAFKHAIFGTPQTGQPNTRRYSNAENARPRNIETKPTRPTLNRPKSAGDAQTLSKQDGQAFVEAASSPTKGILMSPGASAAKKKNVTFGDHVVDNEDKRPLKSGLPDDCPGKFPSPWNKASEEFKMADEFADKGRGRSKLTEAFESVRDESKKRKSKAEKRSRILDDMDDDEEVPAEFAEPKSESGKYWKREYDVYRTNTQREVKKLITKQKAAKSYAQVKDTQCAELADQLKEHHEKVVSLETKTNELEEQIKDLEDKLKASKDSERRHQDEIAMLKRQLGRDSTRPRSTYGTRSIQPVQRDPEPRPTEDLAKLRDDPVQRPSEPPQLDAVPEKPKWDVMHHRTAPLKSSTESTREPSRTERPASPQKTSIEPVESKADPVQRPSEPSHAANDADKARTHSFTSRARTKTKPDTAELKNPEDIWAQSFRSSSPNVSRSEQKAATLPRGGRPVTSGTDATPLKTLSVNTTDARDSRQSPPQSTEVDANAERRDSKTSPGQDKKGNDSLLHSTDLPPPPPEHQSSMISVRAAQRKTPAIVAAVAAAEKLNNDSSIQVPVSSPFHYDTKPLPPKPAPSGPRAGPESKAAASGGDTKENDKPRTQPDINVKPSAMWSSINGNQAGKRSSSMMGKDGKEVGVGRLEAAKARLAARGRMVS